MGARPSGLNLIRRHRALGALGVVCTLSFLGAIWAPRAGLEVHRHADGEHAHVHPSHDVGRAHEHHDHELGESAHHAVELRLAARGTSAKQPEHRHAVETEPSDSGTVLAGPFDPAHLHVFAPFTRSLTSELVEVAVAFLATWLVAPHVLAAPRRSLVLANARGPPHLLPI